MYLLYLVADRLQVFWTLPLLVPVITVHLHLSGNLEAVCTVYPMVEVDVIILESFETFELCPLAFDERIKKAVVYPKS